MYTYSPSKLPNTRIDVADVLRGIAIAGIILIHFLEHMNFSRFGQPKNELWGTIGTDLWTSVFFLLAGKMYAIFALLFGLSFFIQHDNQAQKGKDFRLRFLWRMVLLMLFGILDLLFYNGDILFVYAACGILILPFIRSSNKLLAILIVILALQPIELYHIIAGLINPETKPLYLGTGKLFMSIMPAQSDGTIWDVMKAGVKYGLPMNFAWPIENGRFTQTIYLFLIGIVIGRKRLFYNEGNNLNVWRKVLLWSVVAFIILLPAYNYLPRVCETRVVRSSLTTALNMWKNLAMTAFYVSGIVLIFYTSPYKKALMTIAPFGKMSLTIYLAQSIIGAFLFYNWGLGLYKHCYHPISFVMGAALVVLLWYGARWYLSKFKRGPLEQLWHNLTWVCK